MKLAHDELVFMLWLVSLQVQQGGLNPLHSLRNLASLTGSAPLAWLAALALALIAGNILRETKGRF